MNYLSNIKKYILIAIMVVATAIIGYYVYGKNSKNEEYIANEEMIANEDKTTDDKSKIVVHITGAVQKEGIVTLDENSRVADAIDAAGGLKEDADMSRINLAYILEDGVKIVIPSVNDKDEENNEKNSVETTEDVEVVETIPGSSLKSGTEMININKASQTELEELPGIGPSIALKIINYRNENGKFTTIEDLKKISGIGDNKFENIKNLICVK
ncbi:MAG: helix-hairpin-helix domain-containing protein [Clostridia bacterium]|nr:helix-hairpin-helix domain-containing protein [Clostridia bacterium]